jgi:mannose-6-phosphate isomerase
MALVGERTLIETLSERALRLGFQAKILDIAAPLSIQLHPSRRDAERLNEERPQSYPDPEPKFEGAVALAPTRLLLGWREEAAIKKDIRAIAKVFSSEDWGSLFFLSSSDLTGKEFYQNLLEACFEIHPDSIKELARVIPDLDTQRKGLIMELMTSYPEGDKGIVFACFLNQVNLGEGEGIFIPVGVPHSYVSGCVAEIMLESDNVIRLGLTPKPVDFSEAARCLDYRYHFVSEFMRAGQAVSELSTKHYHLGEGLEIFVMRSGLKEFSLETGVTNCEIIVVLDGGATLVHKNSGASLALPQYGAALLLPKSTYRLSWSSGQILRFRKV